MSTDPAASLERRDSSEQPRRYGSYGELILHLRELNFRESTGNMLVPVDEDTALRMPPVVFFPLPIAVDPQELTELKRKGITPTYLEEGIVFAGGSGVYLDRSFVGLRIWGRKIIPGRSRFLTWLELLEPDPFGGDPEREGRELLKHADLYRHPDHYKGLFLRRATPDEFKRALEAARRSVQTTEPILNIQATPMDYIEILGPRYSR